jgi:hypothetical protein
VDGRVRGNNEEVLRWRGIEEITIKRKIPL